MKIIEEKLTDVSISEMKDGDIGIITKWADSKTVISTIVQRCGGSIIALGEHSEESYPTALNSSDIDSLRVRILPEGTILEI